MITDYFRYINFSQSSFPGFYLVQYRNRSYYACPYGSRNTGKMKMNELMKSLKLTPAYRPSDFDFHHIVERPHLADISCSGSRVTASYGGMPAIMIHKGEHNRYNMILHAGETRQLYMRTDQNLTEDVEKSEDAVRQLVATSRSEAKTELTKRIQILREIYHGVYEENGLLQIIAGNILSDYQERVNKL